MGSEAAYIHPIDHDRARCRVVEARQEIREGRLAAAGLAYERHRPAFGDRQVDIPQHFSLRNIGKRDMLESDLPVERHRLRRCGFGDIGDRREHGVDPLQRSHSASDTVGGFGEVFRGIDDRIEDHQIIDKRGRIDRSMIAEDQQSSEPEDHSYERRSEELREGVRQIIAAVDAVEGSACSVNKRRKAYAQFALGVESFDDPQAEEGLVDSREDLRVLLLSLLRCTFETPPDTSDEEDRDGHEEQDEESELPGDDEEGDEVHEDHDRVLEEYIQRRHDRRLHLVDIIGHAGYHIAPPCLREIPHREREYLVVELLPQVAQNARADGHHEIVRQPCRAAFEAGHQHEEEAQEHQHVPRPVQGYLFVEKAIEIRSQRRDGLLQPLHLIQVNPFDLHLREAE